MTAVAAQPYETSPRGHMQQLAGTPHAVRLQPDSPSFILLFWLQHSHRRKVHVTARNVRSTKRWGWRGSEVTSCLLRLRASEGGITGISDAFGFRARRCWGPTHN